MKSKKPLIIIICVLVTIIFGIGVYINSADNISVVVMTPNKTAETDKGENESKEDKEETKQIEESNNKEESNSKEELNNKKDTDNTEKNQESEKTQNTDKVTKSEENKETNAETKPTDDLSCTISIECTEILDNMEDLTEGKADFIPEDGIILTETEVNFEDGESVFDILYKVARENKIHLEFVNTPGYNSAYIEGISNIYEFDCGALSGWTYYVNGEFINVGSSSHKVSDGDKIEWKYTCSLGDNSFDSELNEG